MIAGLAWAWWPAGQYQPVRATDRGTLVSLGQMVASPTAVARPAPAPAPAAAAAAAIQLTPGRHLAVSMIPVGGATKQHPAMFVISQGKGKPAVAIVSGSAPDPSHASGGTFSPKPGDAAPSTAASSTPPASSSTSTTNTPVNATAFPFQLPSAPGPGGTQALATNTKDGGVLYDVAYSIVTVQDGAPVTNTNSAFAIAHCKACTTVAVSFQIVLVIGQSRIITPINAAGALNYDCTACLTTAIADQIVVTLKSQPSKELAAQLAADLKQLNALPELGSNATPAAVASAVAAVQQEIETQLHDSGLMTTSSSPSSSTSAKTTTSSSSSSGSSTTSTSSSAPPTSSTPTGSTTTTTPASTTTTPTTTTTTTSTTTPTTTTTTASPSADTTTTP
jgi:putative peptide zinc metalloprotease protein